MGKARQTHSGSERSALGVVGLALIGLGIVVFLTPQLRRYGALEFLESLGLETHLLKLIIAALGLIGLGVILGILSWRTRVGKIATALGLIVGLAIFAWTLQLLAAFTFLDRPEAENPRNGEQSTESLTDPPPPAAPEEFPE
jgi:MFS superfamily sulfate permease-like transporter